MNKNRYTTKLREVTPNNIFYFDNYTAFCGKVISHNDDNTTTYLDYGADGNTCNQLTLNSNVLIYVEEGDKDDDN